MIDEMSLIEQKRKERKAAKRKNQRKKITKHPCRHCGGTKHYICLEHNTYVRRHNKVERFFKRLRYNLKKFYFALKTSG
ncbi:MAG: hypothetical protein ABWZ66_11240 [Pyrinomonadaceae bacterium]